MNSETVLSFFKEITRIPRESGHEEQIIAYLQQFAAERNLECKTDDAGNVLIVKEAVAGYENVPTIVLQSHSDMVCEKNEGVEHDFAKDPIRYVIENGWMIAPDTTLGADCGIGIAAQLALLASDVKCGKIECLFTTSEETGLDGAFAIKPGFMKGKYLINLDSEDEGEIYIGCAGGQNTKAVFTYETESVPAGYFTIRINIDGLCGGHSGDDIVKKRANANKLLARFLYMQQAKTDLRLADIQAGGLHNAIPREASCLVSVPYAYKEQIRIDWNIYQANVEEEYSRTEQSMEFILESEEAPKTIIDKKTSRNLILALQAVDNGIYAMCQDIDLVETSSNLANVRKNEADHTIVVNSSQRSSILSARHNMAATIRAAFELAGAEVESGEGYPGWKMNPNSVILKVATDSYRRLFGKEPLILAIHAGLECGLFSEKYPGLDMISVGPTLRGVHSPEERLHIPSVDLVWQHLLDILKNIPA